MAIKKGAVIDLEVDGMAFGGRGLARIDGMAMFVDGAVPGDRVRARVFKKKRNYAEARVVELLSASPDRVEASCPFSGYCGGCKWQFLAYDKQIEYKRLHVAESLEHIAFLQDVPVHETLPSEQVFAYRNKMEFSCSDRRWLLPEELGQEDVDMGFAIGLHVPGTFHKVLDTKKCLLFPALGNDILEDVRQYIKASNAPPYGLKTHEGFWRFLMLRHSVDRDEWMVNIITAAQDRDIVTPLAESLAAQYPQVVSVVNNVTARKAGVAVGEYEIPLAGESALTDSIGPYVFQISANSFFQTNSRGAAMLYETAKRYAGLTGTETVMDLYCGAGTIGIFLSEAAKTVVGMELVESAVADAEKNCRLNSVTNCRFMQGDIRKGLPDMGTVPDVMIIDPPRDGMHKDVVKQVMALAPARIVYVSCNPATLARDLLALKEIYRVEEVQPVDLFPHTFHIESVARLTKRHGETTDISKKEGNMNYGNNC